MCSIKPCYTVCRPQGEKEKTVGPEFLVAPQNILWVLLNKVIHSGLSKTGENQSLDEKVFNMLTLSSFITSPRLPWFLSGKESTCQYKRCGFDSWRKKCQPTPVFLPGNSHGQKSLADYQPQDCKESTQLRRLATHAALYDNEIKSPKKKLIKINE